MFKAVLFAQNPITTYIEQWATEEVLLTNERSLNDLIADYNAIEFSVEDFYDFKKWSVFFFLNSNELREIQMYLQRYKDETSIAFLNRLNIPTEKAYLIRYKILGENNIILGDWQKKGTVSSYILIPDLGVSNIFKNRNRVNIQEKGFKFFLQTEKDQEEKHGLDFVSSGLCFKRGKYRWYLGDYIARFGLGLSFYQGYQQASFFDMNNYIIGSFKLHTGSNENMFLRGVALETQLKPNKKLHFFISSKKTDGRFDSNGITQLFTDGNHSTLTSQSNKDVIHIHQLGGSYSWSGRQFSNQLTSHYTHFNKPLISYTDTFNHQFSISNSMVYITSGLQIGLEINYDLFKYISWLSTVKIHLGNAYYLSTYFGMENKHFKNYFRQLPLMFSTPEKFYSYQLESIKSNTSMYFRYQRSVVLIELPITQKKTEYRFGLNIRLKEKSELYWRSTYKQKIDEEQLTSHLFRNKFALLVKLRGKWRWYQSIQYKFGDEHGVAYSSRFSYQINHWHLKLGFIQYKQLFGALYMYESDIESFGYTKGFFNTGQVIYIMFKLKRSRMNWYSKLRWLNQERQKTIGVSLGFKYRF